jgi:hypothetical protein
VTAQDYERYWLKGRTIEWDGTEKFQKLRLYAQHVLAFALADKP